MELIASWKNYSFAIYFIIRGESSLTNLIAFYSKMTGYVDKGRAVDVIYFNFIKAFDAISCKIIVSKLGHLGR